ncbi:MAG: hypothetical protein Q8P51_18500 [Ignavibacteria bacterium]|nr:hypothetical protein [Ignavibacteria bacterium]
MMAGNVGDGVLNVNLRNTVLVTPGWLWEEGKPLRLVSQRLSYVREQADCR